MESSYATVPLNHVDWEDQRFAIHSHTQWPSLFTSLERVGMLQSPWVWEKEERQYVPVDGFKRLQWAKGTGKDVVCRIFSQSSSTAQLMKWRIECKLLGPPLNTAEKAHIILRLTDVFSGKDIATRFFPLLNLPTRLDAVEDWRRLAQADASLLEAAAIEEVCDRAALTLARWDRDSQGKILAILKELRCSASIQMEILERIAEIAEGGARPSAQMLQDEKLRSILDRRDWNHREKTQAMRDLLYSLRFPRLRAREERFARDVSEMGLPGAVRVIPPPGFEGERWQIQISFSRPGELKALLATVQALADSPRMEILLRPDKFLRWKSPLTPL